MKMFTKSHNGRLNDSIFYKEFVFNTLSATQIFPLFPLYPVVFFFMQKKGAGIMVVPGGKEIYTGVEMVVM